MIAATLLLLVLQTAPSAPETGGPPPEEETRGLLHRDERAFDGYTLIAPLRSTNTYLLDMDGEVVHTWASEHQPGNSVYLLDDGTLLRCGRDPDNPVFHGGGQGGYLQRLAPDGALLWDYDLSNERNLAHHDVEPLPNGNVLVIAWEHKTRAEAIQAGRDAELLAEEGGFWPDMVLELRPEPPSSATVVWEWHAWDHLVQDHDRKKDNFGVVWLLPQKIDVNGDRDVEELSEDELARLRAMGYAGDTAPEGGGGGRTDWLHTNGIDYNAELDQIVLSVRTFNELWVIDHATTTEEAAGPKGDLLYRWGNPRSYRAGGLPDQRFFSQHDAQWIEPGLPGAGDLLVFNNGRDRFEGAYSSVDQLTPPLDADGRYPVGRREAYRPQALSWRYVAPNATDFYSDFISGAQRLPNGNTLICSGAQGRLFEVTPTGEIAWEFLSTYGGEVGTEHGGRRGGDGRAGGARGGRPPGGPPGGGPPSGDGDRGGGDPPGGDPPGGDAGGPPGRGRGGANMSPHGLFRATRLAAGHPGVVRLLDAR